MSTQRDARTCRFCPPINRGGKWGERPLFMSAAGRVKHEKVEHPAAFAKAAVADRSARLNAMFTGTYKAGE